MSATRPFKVAWVAGGGPSPDWMQRAFDREGIDFVNHKCTNADALARVAGDADVLWIYGRASLLTADSLAVATRCGGIVRTGSGTDNIPLDAATRRGIVVVNTPAASAEEVSDHVIAMAFDLIRQISAQDRLMRRGVWDVTAALPHWRMRGCTLGLIGFGHTARCLVDKMRGFDLTVLAYDPHVSPATIAEHGVRSASLAEVMRESDWVSVHCPLTPQTRHLVGSAELALLRPTAIITNAARGAVIDEAALFERLTSGRLLGAGLDVFESEPEIDVFQKRPREAHSALFALDNVVVTPHVGGYSTAYLEHALSLSVDAAIAFGRGEWPDSIVNPDVEPRWPLRAPSPGPKRTSRRP